MGPPTHNRSSLCNRFVQSEASGGTEYDSPPFPAAVAGLLFVSLLSPEETGNNNSRRKHDDNDRWHTHPDASPNNAKMHYEISRKPTYPLIRGL